jgi:TetR/AcrR family transcriptional regulator
MPRLSSTRKKLLTDMMKDAIYEAAVAVLAEHGLEGVTMDRIAAAANLAKGSLYNYFRGKRDLLRFVHRKTVDPILRAVDEVIGSDRPATAKLEASVRIVFRQLGRHRELFTLLLESDGARVLLETTCRTNREVAVAQFAEIFRQGIQQGLFHPFDTKQLAQMFVGAMAELWQRSLGAGEAQSVEPLIATLLSAFLHGIAADLARKNQR